jgi:hypothetical protein
MIEEGADVGTLRYAHSHVGWLQGTGFQDFNKYDHVEIWASPYSPVPSKLAPYQVADEPELPSIFGYLMGAFGKMSYGVMRPGLEHRVWKIWDLEKKTVVEHVLPSGTRAWEVLAMTRDHFWTIGSGIHTGSNGAFLFRLRSTS